MMLRIRAGLVVLALGALALAAPASAQWPGHLERESVDSLGDEAHGQAGGASVSADGRFVSFDSEASNLFAGDINGEDVFVHYSAINSNGFKSLQEGQAVQFNVVKGPKGWQASDVQPL